jgi:hypothetical protein
MVSEAFCTHVLNVFKQTTSAWAQLHAGDPGSDGVLCGCIDRRRIQIEWLPQQGPNLVSGNSLIWSEVQGVPGFPQTIDHITVWSEPTGGVCWAILPITPIRVPHLATLEIPMGLTLQLAH